MADPRLTARHPATLAVRSHPDTERSNRPLSAPLVFGTTFQAESAEAHRDLFRAKADSFYLRFGHPNLKSAGAAVARLEGAEDGLVFASGMAAITTSLLAVLRPGDHVVAPREVFADTQAFLDPVLREMGIACSFVDATDPGEIEAALRPSTRLIYLETPSNPMLQISDVAAAAALARARQLELFVDSTFASPAIQHPLKLGATLVLHSGTKFLGGHNDLMCGAAAGGRPLIDRIRGMQVLLGSVLHPFGAWLLERGVKTLMVRVERQSETALRIARFLGENPAVARVWYPGLGEDRQATVARRQMRLGGGVVTFEVKGGIAAARRFLNGLRWIPIATSLGGTETVVELPYDLDFYQAGSPREVPGVVRLAVGLEEPADLLADLGNALEGAEP